MMVGTEHACFSTFHWKSNTASRLIHQTSSKAVQIEAPGFAPEVSFRFPEAMPAHSPADSPKYLGGKCSSHFAPMMRLNCPLDLFQSEKKQQRLQFLCCSCSF